ncbi:hypothetical protein EJ05DRAFT_393656 [Pseudovirgaria hyperparasitica]|uniref:Uncharacterized protein n=1 Tax=Pseudovirgaria hyperparasitica TaxID=470096 RepID=A0A6A6W6L0_9PEZI|nr:uncharacterized protein EJ05DRAFT_393656 [Pseudovirgaria hyperparasitica]KAF2757546.1 hypothetical protein EJ05DRAFT_393656 [Pseudovirgaria hyperparasitica]
MCTRSEAARLPSVKRAPNATRVEDQGDEYTIDINDEGYFEDGAFVAGKRKQWQPDRLEGETDEDYLEDKSEEEETSISPQEAYYEDLKVRFLQHRALLSTTPPLPRISALKASQPIWIPDQGQSLQCQAIVEENDPVPAQVASMNIETIFRLLNIVARSLVPGGNITKRQSLWIWSLLARLPDAGVMDNWNVHRWRQNIGKRAVILRAVYDERCHQLARRYQLLDENIAWDDANFSNSAEVDQVSERTTVSGDAIKEDSCGTEMVPKDAVDEDEEQAMDLESSDEEGEIDELAEAKQELLQALSASEEATQSLQMESESLGKQDTDSELKGMSSTSKKSAPAEDEEPFPNLNTRVTLDMMITVIGDLYGQRDLLECRADWDEDEESCV